MDEVKFTDLPQFIQDAASCIHGLHYTKRPIRIEECAGLRFLLFQNKCMTFDDDWINQGFRFKEDADTYGLIQNRPGPCGLLAAVQGHLLYHFLFGYTQSVFLDGILQPDIEEKKQALAEALTFILFQAADGRNMVFAMKSDTKAFDTNGFDEDDLMEYLSIFSFASRNFLKDFLYDNITLLMDDESCSCVTFLYSVLLTRGFDRMLSDMDEPRMSLIGPEGYCSQEVVNLLLTGKAVTNTFDGNKVFVSDRNEKMLLYGIERKTRIGFLSKREYSASMKVGNNYKNPKCPIWVIYTEYHFSVLFCPFKNIINFNPVFPLIHYDCYLETGALYNIKLTNTEKVQNFRLSDVKQCILSKWGNATINKNIEEDNEGSDEEPQCLN